MFYVAEISDNKSFSLTRFMIILHKSRVCCESVLVISRHFSSFFIISRHILTFIWMSGMIQTILCNQVWLMIKNGFKRILWPVKKIISHWTRQLVLHNHKQRVLANNKNYVTWTLTTAATTMRCIFNSYNISWKLF